MKEKITVAMRIWNIVKGMSTSELRERMSRAATLTVAGTDANVAALSRRLASERPLAENLVSSLDATSSVLSRVPTDATHSLTSADLHLDADILRDDEAALLGRIQSIVEGNPELAVALARRYPAFRPAVVSNLSHAKSRLNAKLAGLSALPGIIPAGDWLLPVTAAGDMYVLTRNQMELFLEVAASYDVPPDLQARAREFVLVVGGAFLWRAAARQLLGIAPAGIGVAIKAGVAYGGTYAIGRAAAAYYSSGGHRVGPAELKDYIKEGIRARLEPKSLGSS